AEYQARFPDLDPAPLQEVFTAEPSTIIEPPATRARALRCPHCGTPLTPEEDHCPSCGATYRVQPLAAALALPQLGRFQLLERVGAGAFGAVWRARDSQLDRVVALKVPHPGLLSEPGDRERFHREARAAAQLRHPGIVSVHEVVTVDETPILVCDFIEGLTLRELLQVRRLTFPETAELVAQLALALDHAHGLGLVHRDVKPA